MAEIDRKSRVIITGGADGIGRAIAAAFLKDHHSTFVIDVNEAALSETLSKHTGLAGAAADIGSSEQVQQAITTAIHTLGGVDVLINNAGIAGPICPSDKITDEEWRKTIAVNTDGAFYATRSVLPHLKVQRSGAIINIGTASLKQGLPMRLAYMASKGALMAMTHGLARELGPFNVRCNAIHPGAVDNPRGRRITEIAARRTGKSNEEIESEFLRYISMRSMVQEDEIAEAALFLASPRAKHITNQYISVCGNVEWES